MFLWAMAISLLVIFATAIPPVGPILFVALMPIVTLMTLSACKRRGRPRHAAVHVAPLQKPGVFRKLFLMGLLYAALCMVIGLLAFLPFSGSLSEAVRVASMEKDITPLLSALMVP